LKNRYFKQGTRNEQNLYEDIILESIQIHGLDIEYLPRELVNKDIVTGEDIMSRFEDAYTIEMYLESIDGWDGEEDLFTKFGVEIRDAATFVVARRRFEHAVATYEDDAFIRPREGDLIYIPLTNSIFEITMVEDDKPFYQLENLTVYKMRTELFEYAGEDFDTEQDTIDDVELQTYNQIFTLVDSGETYFNVGENITYYVDSANGDTVAAEIVDWDASINKLSIAHIAASDGDFVTFTAGKHIISEDTNITRTIASIGEDLSAEDMFNSDYSSELEDLLDTSFSNPFGNVN